MGSVGGPGKPECFYSSIKGVRPTMFGSVPMGSFFFTATVTVPFATITHGGCLTSLTSGGMRGERNDDGETNVELPDHPRSRPMAVEGIAASPALKPKELQLKARGLSVIRGLAGCPRGLVC